MFAVQGTADSGPRCARRTGDMHSRYAIAGAFPASLTPDGIQYPFTKFLNRGVKMFPHMTQTVLRYLF